MSILKEREQLWFTLLKNKKIIIKENKKRKEKKKSFLVQESPQKSFSEYH